MTVAQLDLLSWQGRARHSDPGTSKEAAARARRFAGKQHVQILEILRSAGQPLSAEEIGDRIPHSDNVRVARRTSELLQSGQIEVADSDHVNRSGSRARRYGLVHP